MPDSAYIQEEGKMRKTIGILGGMGPLATADLFRKLVMLTKASCDNEHIRVYIDSNAAIPDRTAAILHGGENPLEEMTSALRHLEKCGSDCIIMPCNTAHYYLPQLQSITAVPILSMPEITARCCAERYPGKTAAILATDGTLQTGIYDQALARRGIAFLHPDAEKQKYVMYLAYGVVKAGAPIEPEREKWRDLLYTLRQNGADYFILGCTELT